MSDYEVIDNVTGHPVRSGMTEENAASLCRGLNLNAGPGGRYGVRPTPAAAAAPHGWEVKTFDGHRLVGIGTFDDEKVARDLARGHREHGFTTRVRPAEAYGQASCCANCDSAPRTHPNDTYGELTGEELASAHEGAKKCLRCGMLATVDPILHESRYGHAPVIKDGTGELVWSSDGFSWIANEPSG